MKHVNEGFIKNLKLIDNTPYAAGRNAFWHMIQEFMSSQFFGMLAFGTMKERVNGYFKTDQIKYDQIVIQEDSVKLVLEGDPDSITGATGGTMEFKDEKAFAVFIHECSHYLHFAKDNGEYISPALKGFTPPKFDGHGFSKLQARYFEYEAGWRSLYYSDIYSMFAEGDRTVLENNLSNMSNYVIIENMSEFDHKKAKFKRHLDKWIKKTAKFSSLCPDFKIVI